MSNPELSGTLVLTSEKLEEIADVFKGLGAGVRLKIFLYLCFGNKAISVSTICDNLALSVQLTSHHLRELKRIGLVGSRSNSPFELYYPKREILGIVINLLSDAKKKIETRPVEDV